MSWSQYSREIGLDALYDVQPPQRTAGNPSASTIPLNADYMKVFGLPLEVEEIIVCKVCAKPVLQSAYLAHIDNCAAASALQQAAAAEATPGKVEKVNSFKSDLMVTPPDADQMDLSGLDPNTPSTAATPRPSGSGNKKKKLAGAAAAAAQASARKNNANVRTGPIDLDKQCGVFVTQTGEPCGRSLACKVHSKLEKRGVVGRSDTFENLLLRAQAENKARMRGGIDGATPTINRRSTQQDLLAASPLASSGISLQPAFGYPLLDRKISSFKSRLAFAHALRQGLVRT